MSDARTVLPAPKLLDLIGVRATENAITQAARVAAALEMNVGACLSLFSRLVDDDYLRISGGPEVLRGNLPTPVMSHIPREGLAEIGEVPNSNERLVVALEVLARIAEADDRVPQTIAQRMCQAAADVNTLSTLGTNVGRLFANYFGAG